MNEQGTAFAAISAKKLIFVEDNGIKVVNPESKKFEGYVQFGYLNYYNKEISKAEFLVVFDKANETIKFERGLL